MSRTQRKKAVVSQLITPRKSKKYKFSVRCIRDHNSTSDNATKVKVKENINSNDIDSLQMYGNNIYDDGIIVGRLVILEFTKEGSQAGRVFNVPEKKMWTPLVFDYLEFGNNSQINVPKILTEQNSSRRIGRDYYHLKIYDDKDTNTWWEKESGFYIPAQDEFRSIKFSMRNIDALSDMNAIYVGGFFNDVKYRIYFFEENI